MVHLMQPDDENFPPPSEATEIGLLAIGGAVSPERLLKAYHEGIFPWYEEGQPVMWWSPDPRFVLFPENLKCSKSMQKLLRQHTYRITWNTAFTEVVDQCARIRRKDQDGTWITSALQEAYEILHRQGYAQSVEVWDGEILAGGLYGIALPSNVFCGESMFSLQSNTSKLALYELVTNGGFKLIDCQVYTDHLAGLGATSIPRDQFLQLLNS